MTNIEFRDLDELFECYGRENLIAIDNIKQAIFYTKNGCQPKFVYENELKPGKVSFWFIKAETSWVWHKWMSTKPTKDTE